jgi:Tfp pilus assembly protein PilF
MLAALTVVVVLPLALYGSMMLRARLDPAVNWGRPVDLQGLWAHGSALAYRHLDLGWAGILRPVSWQRFGDLISWELTPLALPLAALGLAGLPRRWGGAVAWRARAAVGLLLAAGLVFGLRYSADDIEVFFLPAFTALALAAGLGVATLRAASGAAWRHAGIAAAILVVVVPAVQHFRSRDLGRMTAAADYGRDVLNTVPRGAVLFVESDDAFPLVYLTQVLGERTDLRIYHREGYLFDNVVDELRLPRGRGEPWRAYRVRVEQVFIDRELSRPESPGAYFLGWPGYDVPPRYRMEPAGLLHRIARADAPPPDWDAVWAGYREQRIRAQAERSDNGFGLVAAATYSIARGERALHDGDAAAAHAAFDEARRLGRWTAPVHNYIGTVYGRFGFYDRAIEMFRGAIEAKPSSIAAWNNLAKACLMAGDNAGARRAWTRSLELLPGQTDVLDSLRRLDAVDQGPG